MDLAEITAKARVLLEALPYIQDFHGSIFVVKYGGSFMDDPDPVIRTRVAYDIAATMEKIRQAGLPERMATRLAAGR